MVDESKISKNVRAEPLDKDLTLDSTDVTLYSVTEQVQLEKRHNEFLIMSGVCLFFWEQSNAVSTIHAHA